MKFILGLFGVFILNLCCQNSTSHASNTTSTTISESSTPEPKKKVTGEMQRLNLPDGYSISVYADEIQNARSLAYSDSGVLYVGTRSKGNVYALRDMDGDGYAEHKVVLLKNSDLPNGVALKDGDLYVSEVNRILKFENIDQNLDQNPEPVVVYDGFPTEKHHGWKFIDFGPDGKLYVPVGAPCNICESDDPIFASIARMNPDGTDIEIVQRGVRNTVGFTWHPVTKELWFTDNGRDRLGNDKPFCELNRAKSDNMHFGYPYCHQGDLADKKFGHKRSCDEFEPPFQNLGPHVAPLGCEFVTSTQFPKEMHNNTILIAEHGSWNRDKKIGYRITKVGIDANGKSTGYEVFIDGWLDDENQEIWGRPVDLEWLPDGSLLISDDFADMIYRLEYNG